MGFACPSPAQSINCKSPTLHSINGSSLHPIVLMYLTQNPSSSIHLRPKPSLNGHFKIHRRKTHIQQYSPTRPKFKVGASIKNSHVSSSAKVIIVSSAITVILAIANRVLYKLALVPLKEYPFFLAQFTTFGYVAIYFSILYIRFRAGIVTYEMMALPKSRFIVIGILEALGVVAGMSSGAMLPGPAIPILNQTFLVWQLAFSTLLLGRRYSLNRILGCLLVASGVIVAVASGSDPGQMLSGIGFVWPALMIASSAFQAGSSILAEFVFIDAAARLKGKLLDIFVVNSFGSGFQALFVLLFLPFLSNLKGVPFSQLPLYLKSGAGCFFNIEGNTPGCDGAPLLPLLYITTNIAFNISLLNLVKISSAVVSSLAAMSSGPISIYILSLPLPYLPEGANLSPFFLFGSVILVMGLILYNIPQPLKQDSEILSESRRDCTVLVAGAASSAFMGFACPSPAQSINCKFPTLHSINGSSLHPIVLMYLPQNPSSSIHLRPKPSLNGHFKIHRRKTHIQQYSPTRPKFTVRASIKNSHVSSSAKVIIVSSAITVILAIANRVLYKLALVPLKEYPFFLAQFTTFGYVAIYFSILYIRYRAGIVTDEMMALPKSRFIVIGILEALGVVAGMSSGAMLPGPAIPILNQTFLVWQLAFSTLLLGRRYSLNRILGCLLVASGVIVAVASGSDPGQMLSGIGFVWPALMIASSAFQAGSSILKESVFIDAAARLKGKLLDIFVVNSFGSGFQALFVLLFLPFLSNLKGVPFSQLPLYLKSGAGCFLNIAGNTPGCDGAPLLPLLYITTNIAFNISLLNLVKISSAVVSSLAATSSVPISIYILSLPLPYLPEGANLSPFFLFGSVILVMGLILYNIPQPLKQDSEIL
ncbi:hypothetical protein F0562_027805 [Nyssa sinensis]|uniref:Uncharacterized protein n=1 Tax=Nyssa sinensis TaxID=561372 RepID=A0A5J5B8X1_9ASTE|nr:hypothetical protein F0562_027805 [Nyssa sinensis]